MDMNQTSQLVLKSVNQLFEYRFFIPAYQRGYRWKETQVTQLLEDVWRFAKNPPKYEQGEEKPFYCLQPVVVKKIKDNEYEVIDGQQRLTTLFLVLKKLQNLIETSKKNFEGISYETRTDSWEFLKNVENKTENEAKQNVDYWHIWQAYQTILKWFQDKANNSGDATPSVSIAPSVLNDAKVIWYETSKTEDEVSEDGDETNDLIDIFTRLNIGKIPLTNAELIKALFLQKGNFAEKEATLKQIQIASEWDTIEKTLQDDAFWFFIYNPENPLKYDNRIEYIFDLMKRRTKELEDNHTFNKFVDEDFSKNKKDDKPDIDTIWLKIKEYFLTFEEWFKDYELFHYIGYLIACIKKDKNETKYTKNIIETINSLKDKSFEVTKKEFKEYLKKEIKKQVDFKIDKLHYQEDRDDIRKVLLLFNIQTVLETQKSDMRFPFHKYKSEAWHIEHVRSQKDKEDADKIEGNTDEWVDDIFDYFVGSNDEAKICEFVSKSEISKDSEDIKKICSALLDYRKETNKNQQKEKFNSIYSLVQTFFQESEKPDNIHSISNLALLDAKTNCSYGNAFFPIKRKRIINNDKNGIFVPICTKNLFLKYYSKKLGEVMYWKSSDADDYLQAIEETLKEFLPPKEANPIAEEE
jgi:uncharacterized protein with ParB-like and HNH nuclease domain